MKVSSNRPGSVEMQIDISVPKHVVEKCREIVKQGKAIPQRGALYPVVSDGFWLCDILVDVSEGEFIYISIDAVVHKKDNTTRYLEASAVGEWKRKGAIHCRFIEDHYFEIPCPHCDGSGVACNFEPEFPEVKQ